MGRLLAVLAIGPLALLIEACGEDERPCVDGDYWYDDEHNTVSICIDNHWGPMTEGGVTRLVPDDENELTITNIPTTYTWATPPPMRVHLECVTANENCSWECRQ